MRVGLRKHFFGGPPAPYSTMKGYSSTNTPKTLITPHSRERKEYPRRSQRIEKQEKKDKGTDKCRRNLLKGDVDFPVRDKNSKQSSSYQFDKQDSQDEQENEGEDPLQEHQHNMIEIAKTEKIKPE